MDQQTIWQKFLKEMQVLQTTVFKSQKIYAKRKYQLFLIQRKASKQPNRREKLQKNYSHKYLCISSFKHPYKITNSYINDNMKLQKMSKLEHSPKYQKDTACQDHKALHHDRSDSQ